MAIKQIWTDLEGMKVGILKDWRHNPLNTTQRNALGALLSGAHTGLQCFDTNELLNYYWTGTAWTSGVAQVQGAMNYKGAYSNLTAAPGASSIGDTYVMTAAGNLTWAGITFSPNAVVQVGDMIVKRTANTWDIVQGNDVASSETVAGIIRIATQAEVNLGTDDTTAVTPLKLKSYNSNLARVFFATIDLVGGTAYTFPHNLALQNKDAFVISVKDSAGSEVGVDIDSIDTNSLTITSSIAATSVKVMVVGR